TASDSHDFDTAFRRFLRDNDYSGGTVGVLKDGLLVLAKGYGVTREGTEVKTGSRSPVSSLSKSLTAVAVLRLVQQGLLDLEDTVFGKKGILHMIKPLKADKADPRLEDITVGHLLRHSAGWDLNKAPLFDPVLNELYQSRGHAVPDIAREMDEPTPLDFYAIIQYTISQPLHFTPGTKVVYSNLGYLVLGRVVEEASGMMYEDYVKKFILNPCGMWHTRLGMPPSAARVVRLDEDVPIEETPVIERRDNAGELSLFEILDPRSVDSALGWFSTVYDMARFARCVFEGDAVLNDASLELLLQRQDSAPVLHSDSWVCAGFHTNTQGVVWQDGDQHADDVILYHNLNPDDSEAGRREPDTWVVLLHGSKLHHLRHKTRELMGHLQHLLAEKYPENHFARDLSDINASAVSDGVLVKFTVDEHHLDAYVTAVKQEGYNIQWVSPYTHQRHTSFIITSRLVSSTDESQFDFKLEHGLTEKQLLSKKLHMERHDYNITFLQSYRSQSHEEPNMFLAIFRKHAFAQDTQLKYGTDHLPEPYDKLVQMYQEKKFYPLVQSVVPHADGQEEHLSFIFVQTPSRRKSVDFKNYYRLADNKLEKTILANAKQGRILSFLDAYELQGKTRFAAVFTNETKGRWYFQGGLEKGQAVLLIETRLPTGLWPTAITGYMDKEAGEVKFAIFMQSEGADTVMDNHNHYQPNYKLSDTKLTDISTGISGQ
ncbi:hypothetical protein BaRGS_00016548, partial [Batillaria attramentaria]